MMYAVICFANAIDLRNLPNPLCDTAFRSKVNKKVYKENSKSSEKVNVMGLYRFTPRRSRCALCKL
jgi:hypothetical protein